MEDRNRIALTMVIVAAFAAGFLGRAVVVYGAAQPSDSSSLTLTDGEAHDFGKVMRGEILAASFVVSNRSNGAVQLELGPASCGCTVATLAKTRLSPAESTSVKCEIDTTGRSGLFSFSIPLIIRRGSSKEATTEILRVRGNIDAAAGVFHMVSFGELRRGAGKSAKLPFEVTVAKGALSVKSMAWSAPLAFITAQADSAMKRGEGTIIHGEVCVNPDAAEEGMQRFITKLLLTVQTDSSSKVVAVPISGFLIEAVRAEPKVLYWDSTQTDPARTITFDAVGDGLLEITRVTARDQKVVMWRIVDNGTTRPKLCVERVDSGTKESVARTELTVSLMDHSNGKVKDILIPVLAL